MPRPKKSAAGGGAGGGNSLVKGGGGGPPALNGAGPAIPIREGPSQSDFIGDIETGFKLMGGAEQNAIVHGLDALQPGAAYNGLMHIFEGTRFRSTQEETLTVDIIAHELRFLPKPKTRGRASSPREIPLQDMPSPSRFAILRMAAAISGDGGVGRKQLLDMLKGVGGMLRRALGFGGGRGGGGGGEEGGGGGGYGREVG